MNLLVEHATLGVAACAGALAAQGRRIDLFGVLVLALVTSFGGGTVRDLCLDVPVIWLHSQEHLITTLGAALFTFFIGQRVSFPIKLIDYVDAISLALYAIAGTHKAMQANVSPAAAVTLGTITGVAGGILRDILLNEVPTVFSVGTRLYATAAICGCTLYVILWQLSFPLGPAGIIAGLTILAMRVAALHFPLSLPEFEERKK